MRRHPKPSAPEGWRRAVLEYIAGHPDRPSKLRGLARELGLADSDYTAFRTLIQALLDEGTVVLGAGRCLALPGQRGPVVGTLRRHPRGFAFLEVPGQADVYVGRDSIGDALDGDTVAARLLKPRRRGAPPAAEVVRVVTRAPIRWVGTLERAGRRWVVQPQGRAVTPLVQIDDPTAKAARPGDLVVVEPLEHTLGTATVRGVIVERLGPPDRTQTKILAIIRRHGIPDEFPAEVRRAAQRMASAFNPDAFDDREDLRELLTVTIDPPDARDFDDAISLRKLGSGRIELGVHIADVAHFVPPDSVLDREAHTRGSSVYFPGYVVPMLPEALSNGVCSLQPGEPRLAKSVFVTYDEDAQPAATRFVSSVIRSARRLTYQEVTEALAGRDTDVEPRVAQLLRAADGLARRIRERRLRDGMIVLTLPEVEIRLDDRGDVVDAGPADSSFSHTIIEMFMVEANEAVSRQLTRAGFPHLRRIHPPPQPTNRDPLRPLAAVLGERPPRVLDRQGILAVLSAVRGRPAEPAVNLVLLQSMAQATYGPGAEGHFALASADYCHFTSPIRRYPDLVNHRALNLWLQGGHARRRREHVPGTPTFADLTELGRHTSAMERRAQQAERDARHALLMDLMKSKLGEVFDGVVCGVVSFGIFVQVWPYLAEGLIHVSDFGGDHWQFDERSALWLGRRSGAVVGLGQAVRVRVAVVDENRQEMRLVPANDHLVGAVQAGNRGRPKAREHRRGGRATASKRR